MNLALLSADLKRDEGYSPTVYKDSEGLWTVGIGFLVDPTRHGCGLTPVECDLILHHRIAIVHGDLSNRLPWLPEAPEPVQRALMNMAYQLGVVGLMRFTETLELLRKRKYEDAARESLDSAWAVQTPARAQRMADLFRQAAWDQRTTTTTEGTETWKT